MSASRRDRRTFRPGVDNLEGRALMAYLPGPLVAGFPDGVAPVLSLDTMFTKNANRFQAATRAATNVRPVTNVRPQVTNVRSQVVRVVESPVAPNFQTLLNPPEQWLTTLRFQRAFRR